MKSYYRVMLGKSSVHSEFCYKEKFIGVDFGIDFDLKNELPDNWREFNEKFIPIYLAKQPGKSKISAGLACGFLWTVCKGITVGDIVLSPNGSGGYYVGEVMEGYSYHPNEILPHRRSVKWNPKIIDRSEMSETLKRSAGSIGTVSNISKYSEEIERLLAGTNSPTIISTDETIEDPSEFALEKHLEDFLVQNWKQSELGKNYDIFEEEGEIVGQQYPSDTGPIDILAISKDKKELLVVELKKRKASDNVVGQIQRYMGFVLEKLTEEGQTVKGIIIAHEDDLKIRRALSVTNNIEFYKFQVSFKLIKS